ncbi:uncharacterized protein LOC132832853 isoform X1 [Hemiscyllium ocellatum]|uniref:uncharacterized protein LOC132832853 isoform X1 n=1 Tax=Hemiscyllium ocellatum TaxID=170820 RepID=UPI002965F44D|nr:uncharacterized protein LOC132832853 isoform X1 [Hemiscyllium ocellatum]
MSPNRSGIPKMCGACLFAFNPFALLAAVTLRVSQDSVNGTVGESVLLAASYTVSDPDGYLRIRWTRAGIRMVDYRCISDRDHSLSERCHYLPVPGDYKHRVVLFPENASLLLQRLHFNDSGIYELSISHSQGTEIAKITLVVQNTTECGMDTNMKKTPRAIAKIRYASLVVILIFLCFTVKTQRGCNRIQKQTVKKKIAQGGWNSLSNNSAVTFSEVKLYKSTGATGATGERRMHATDENIEHARIQILRT